MEDNLSSGNMITGGAAYGDLDLQGPMRVHRQQQPPFILHQQHHSHPRQASMNHPTIPEGFPLSRGSLQDSEQTMSLADHSKGERGKNYVSDEDEPSFMEDSADDHIDSTRGKKISPWHRVKWTDIMVRLLITSVSYIGEEAAAECAGGARRRYANLHKKGKWKTVSKVMAERGHFVSPQQCEDKFNDLNKRYKRLNEILGRGTSCDVVENPALLDMLDHISEKAKDEVRKILSSKHLYYEEMCSYHNGNRLHLLPDPELQRSLRLALRSRDDHENNDVRRQPQNDPDDDDEQDAEVDEHDECEDNHFFHENHRGVNEMPVSSAKRIKHCLGHGNISVSNSLNFLDCNKTFSSQPQDANAHMNQALPENMKTKMLQEQWMDQRSLQLEEQKVKIQAQMLELERERFKWQRFCEKRDRELEIMRMENERRKLENERMALELKRREMGADK
ncbi:unnamed protein product [Ilex paraguariensis]|uniref:Myb/SANT-like DNA-binding domain-containing protein n=1 Tax=Ilex paraguariensis TaxID=185542 RepID=A0ABC8V1Y7_9AQUA